MAGAAAAGLNAVVYLGASALGAMPQDVVVQGRGPITLGLVVANSFVPALLAAVAFALLGRFARRPASSFRVLAAVVFVLSLAAPFLVAGAPVTMRAALLLMHAVAAAAITGVLATLAVDRGWRVAGESGTTSRRAGVGESRTKAGSEGEGGM